MHFDHSLLESYQDLFNEKATVPYFEVALSEDERKAMQTQSYNSQKRLAIERRQGSAPMQITPGAGSTFAGGSPGNTISSTPSSRQQPYGHQTKKIGQRPAREEGNYQRTTEQDPWSSSTKEEMGVFDEHGVFKSVSSSASTAKPIHPDGGREQFAEDGFHHGRPAATMGQSGAQGQSVSSKSAFERLRERGSTANQESFQDTSSAIHQGPPGGRFVATGSEQSNDDKWLYRDPSGNIQGPFSNKEMFDWFQMGYFPPTLPIKRVTDPGFEPLGLIIARLDGIPFVAGLAAQSGSGQIHPMQNAGPSGYSLAGKAPSSGHSQDVGILPQKPVQPMASAAKPENVWETNVASLLPTAASAIGNVPPQQPAGSAMNSKMLEDMLMKDLGISKPPVVQDKPKEQQPLPPAWNLPAESKQAAVPAFDEIQSQQRKKPTETEKAASSAPTKQQPIQNTPRPEKPQPSRAPIISGSTWGTAAVTASPVKSLEEIQREEASRQKELPKKELPTPSVLSAKPMSEILQNNLAKMPHAINASTTIPSQQSKPAQPNAAAGATAAQKQPQSQPPQAKTAKAPAQPQTISNGQITELTEWCKKELKTMNGIDVSTFVAMLLEFTSAKEMKNHIEDALGTSERANSFASEFIRRAKPIVPSLKTEEDEYVVVSKKGRKNK